MGSQHQRSNQALLHDEDGGYRIHLRQVGRRSLVLFGQTCPSTAFWFRAVSTPQGFSRMKMERAMPAGADLFARGFKGCGLGDWGGQS